MTKKRPFSSNINTNRELLRSIYEDHRDGLLILGIALSHDVCIAEDAVHDVFVKFAENFNNFKRIEKLNGYLAKSVANRVRDLLRQKDLRQKFVDRQSIKPAGNLQAGQDIICNEELKILSAALAQLPYEQREVIVLRIYGQMRFGVIAKNLEISINTAKGRYRYGIARLRSILNSEK